jgi:hypothetical protein
VNLAAIAIWQKAALLSPPAVSPPAEITAQKGHCRHCGKKIGRGLHFHERACKK